ncbi:serine hydrolase domain-containing protein [Lentilactobacillus hilgardii]|uniref:serine hydrolase domain-containing protein n=1 Tax=Lentilactobacillus hilgardii TaxID=1588 RepID=UPI0039E7D04F
MKFRNVFLKWAVGGLIILLVAAGGWLGCTQYSLNQQSRQLAHVQGELRSAKRAIRYQAMVSRLREDTIRQFEKNHGNQDKLVAVSKNPAVNQLLAALKRRRFVGTALVVKNGRTIYHRGFGYANFAKRRRNTANSAFLINSILKSLTGAMLMQEVGKGKLKVSDKLSKFYPKIKGAQQITLHQMLEMTSGLFETRWPKTVTTENQLLSYVTKHAYFQSQQVGRFNYQPVNFIILAGVLKKVTGQSYYELFNRRIIQKYHLQQTGFLPTLTHIYNGAIGYGGTLNVRNYRKVNHFTAAGITNQLGVGDVYMSTGDLYRIERRLVTGRLTSPALTALQTTPVNSNGIYSGGLYKLRSGIGFYGHGLGNFYEDSLAISNNGQDAVVLLSNYFEARTMKKYSGVPVALQTLDKLVEN